MFTKEKCLFIYLFILFIYLFLKRWKPKKKYFLQDIIRTLEWYININTDLYGHRIYVNSSKIVKFLWWLRRGAWKHIRPGPTLGLIGLWTQKNSVTLRQQKWFKIYFCMLKSTKKMKLIYVIEKHKMIFSIRNSKKSTKISCTDSHKIFLIYYKLKLEIARSVLPVVLYIFVLFY